MLPKKIVGAQVFLEGKRSRMYVGLLKRRGRKFFFEYDKSYLKAKNVIPLGPEMPLTSRSYASNALFTPFSDRIPSRENPAYRDYCKATGISTGETDPFILLTTIAHRGPSSFIFEPLYEENFTADDFLAFRKSLGLSVKEFAACFDFSPAAVTRVELKQSSGREVLKRAEMYARFPEVAIDQIRRSGGTLHPNKLKRVREYLNHLQANRHVG
jgi:HipA-like protein